MLVMIPAATVFLVTSCLLRHCVAVHPGSFTKVEEGFGGEAIKVYAGNPIACAGRCAEHETCGAFHWDDMQMPRCTIFANVWESAENVPGTFYSGTVLSNGDGLLRKRQQDRTESYYPQAERCSAMGHKLILIPTTPRDVTIVASHGRVTFNARRDGLTEPMVTYSGDPVDTSLVRLPIAEEAARAHLSDQCFGSANFNLWLMGCDWGPDSTSTICQYNRL